MQFKKYFLTRVGIDLAIIIAAAILAVFIGSDMRNRAAKITSLRDGIDFWTQSTESLALLREDRARAQNYSAELQNRLPSRDELLNFSRDLNIIANQNKVGFNSSLGNEERGANDKLGRVSFNLTAEGALDNILNLAKGIKNSRYFVNTTNFDLVAKPGDGFRLSMNGQVFSFYSR